MNVNPLIAPNVSMSANSNPICYGDNAIFTVTDSTDAGTDPSFAWFINGTPTGGDQNSISSTTLNDGDSVSVIITSNASCPLPATDTASITMNVTGLVTPAVVMSVDNNPICAGDNATFTVTDSTGGGTDPSFAWFVNGTPTGGDQNSISSTTLADGDSVAVVMTTNSGCATVPTDTASVIMNVNPLMSPNVVMSADNNPICQGDNVTFTVTDSTNAGTDPSFAWFINGAPTGGDQNSISSTTLNDGDSVSVIITSNASCPSPLTDTANVTMIVNPDATPDAGPDVSFCSGTGGVNLNATGAVSYLWTPSTGLSADNISNPNANPAVTTEYIVNVVDINGCLGSDTINVKVKVLDSLCEYDTAAVFDDCIYQ